MGDDLQDRITAIEDRTAISELLANYTHGIDKAKPDLFRPLWLPDAVWEFPPPMGVYKGIDQIMGAWGEMTRQSPRMHHVSCGVVVESLSRDEALVRSDCVAQPGPPDGPMPPLMFADYQDQLRKVDGSWKFAHRLVRMYAEPVLEITDALA